MKLIPFFFLASLASAARLGSRKLAKDSPEPVAVDGEYIVLLKKGNMPEKVLTKKFLGPKAKIDAVYGGIDGALLKNVTKKDVARLTRHPLIEVVEAVRSGSRDLAHRRYYIYSLFLFVYYRTRLLASVEVSLK